MNTKLIHKFVIGIFVTLYLLTSTISTIHVIDFFQLSNPNWLAITLAIAFEIGAAASLAGIIILEKTSKNLVWGLFILLTAMQMMGNMYYAYDHLQNYQSWVELFGLTNESLMMQKRILAIISGGVLPLVALGFIKSLVDYVRPNKTVEQIESHNDVALPQGDNLNTDINTVDDEITTDNEPDYDTLNDFKVVDNAPVIKSNVIEEPEVVDNIITNVEDSDSNEENNSEETEGVDYVYETKVVPNIDENNVYKGDIIKKVKVYKHNVSNKNT